MARTDELSKTHLTTEVLAETVGVKPDTIRRGFCTRGHYLGLRPIKLSNNRLLWPTAKLREILGLEA